MHTRYFIIIGLVAIWAITASMIYADAQVRTITVDNSNRREYTYCPLSDSDVKSFGGEINGCPLMRVYVKNWNNLTPLQQSTIDTLMRGKGFVDAGEHVIR